MVTSAGKSVPSARIAFISVQRPNRRAVTGGEEPLEARSCGRAGPAGMMTSDSRRPITSAAANPKVRSAAGLNSVDAAFAVHGDDGVEGGGEDGALAGLTGAQGLHGPFALADVAADGREPDQGPRPIPDRGDGHRDVDEASVPTDLLGLDRSDRFAPEHQLVQQGRSRRGVRAARSATCPARWPPPPSSRTSARTGSSTS